MLITPAATVPQSPFVIDWIGQESLRYTFDVLRLWGMSPERVLSTTFYELWPLASLMAGVTAETTLAVAERIAAAPVPPQDRDELSRLLILLAGLGVPRPVLREALRRKTMLEDLWKESSLAGALEDRARERGMGEMVQVVLESRFGPLSDDVVAALRTADEATLRAIGEHIMTDSLEQVRGRLGLA